jgi:hypothetical protein
MPGQELFDRLERVGERHDEGERLVLRVNGDE